MFILILTLMRYSRPIFRREPRELEVNFTVGTSDEHDHEQCGIKNKIS